VAKIMKIYLDVPKICREICRLLSGHGVEQNNYSLGYPHALSMGHSSSEIM